MKEMNEQEKPFRAVTPKMLVAEKYVDRYIEKFKVPPTYREVAKDLGLSSSNSAFVRLRRYRSKMKQQSKKQQILDELSTYLSWTLMTQIELSMAISEPIQLCLSICDVVKEYNSTSENEIKVSCLLSNLLKYHCSKYKP